MGIGRRRQTSAKTPSVWVVVEDLRAGLFAVFGPLNTDVQLVNQVVYAQERGRDLTCCTVCSELDVKTLTQALAAYGFSQTRWPIL
jgi:hypothetical protein